MRYMDKILLISVIAFIAETTSVQHGKMEGLDKAVLKKRSIASNGCIALHSSSTRDLHEFGEIFGKLVRGLDKIQNNITGNAILFFGNTGVGKSSLVHLLAGETDNFVAKDIGEDTGEFYIEDISGNFVGNSTIESTTTYPEAIMDVNSSVVLFDTPGFRDTRSPIHEIIVTYGLQRVAEVSQRIKIALLVNYKSLTPLGPRDDFTKTLESYFNLFKNTKKYQDSTYLIATKTENRFVVRKGEIFPVSDRTFIKSIVQFLKSVTMTLNNQEKQNVKFDQNFINNTHSLIGSLIHSGEEESIYNRISLFMQPEKSGPISDSKSIQQSLKSIREMLLHDDDDDDGYVDMELDDFGFTLSDSAKLYIKNLYELMNNHIIFVSKTFASSLQQFIGRRNQKSHDIDSIRSSLQNTKNLVEVSIHTIGASAYPHQYADAISSLVDGIGAEMCNIDVLNEIKQLDDYLNNLRNITGHSDYTPSRWSESLNNIERFVQNEITYYSMLESLYYKLSNYSVVNADLSPFSLTNVSEFGTFMKSMGLDQFASLKIADEKLDEINNVLNTTVFAESLVTCNCDLKVLVIEGSLLRTNLLDKSKMATCLQAKTVAFLATKKLYIDSNIGVDLIGGRNLVVIAPELHVMDNFTLSVDGESVTENLGTAAIGKLGLDGQPGHSAGTFVGVALQYINSEQLTISAKGGDGQNGQHGGDGINGEDGHDGYHKEHIVDDRCKRIHESKKTICRDLYFTKANYGTKGGDAGWGGLGGPGGLPGNVKMQSLSKHSQDRSTHQLQSGASGVPGRAGTPGKGGLRGCDNIFEVMEIYSWNLFFTDNYLVDTFTNSYAVNCTRLNPDGEYIHRKLSDMPVPPSVPPPPPICDIYKMMTSHFESNDNIISHSSTIEFQRAFQETFNCKVQNVV